MTDFGMRLCDRFLVFHGGSGSTKEEIKTAVENGVVKMNVDTGTFASASSLYLSLMYIGRFRHPVCLPCRYQGESRLKVRRFDTSC